MSSSDLARLVVKLEAQTASYDASLKKANRQLSAFRKETGTALGKMEKQFQDFGKNIVKSFALGSVTTAIYGLTRAVGSAIQAGDDLAKFASKSGLAAEAASELAHAAKMTDLDLTSLATGIKKMQVTLSQAGSGMRTAEDTLKALGLTFERIISLKPDQQFELLAEQISQLKDPADRTRAAVELFGRSGADLLPLFEQGAEGIRKAREEAQRLGKSFSADDLAKFSAADDAFKRLGSSGSALADAFAIKLSPAITAVADSLTRLVSGDFSKSQLFALLATPPNVSLLGFIKQLTKAGKDLQASVSSGPTGRSLPGLASGAVPPGFAWLKEVEKQAKLTASQLEELERFANQGMQMRNDAASALNSIAPTLDENTAALNGYFAKIRDEGVAATDRVIRLGEAYRETTDEISIYAEQAARNMQDHFADFLFDPFADGLKGMLKGFIDTLRQMIANQAASMLFERSGLGNLLGNIFAGIGGGGGGGISARASGGPVSSGKPYVVGEKGPELFVPGASGNIVANGAMGSIVINQHMDNRGASSDFIKALPGILRTSNDSLESRIIEGIRRGRYDLG